MNEGMISTKRGNKSKLVTLTPDASQLNDLILTSIRGNIELQSKIKGILNDNKGDFSACLEPISATLVEPIQKHIDLTIQPIVNKINYLEHHSRTHNVRFSGIDNNVPLHRLKNVIVNVVSQSGLKLNINQIEVAHRIGKPKPNRTVIACFYSQFLLLNLCFYFQVYENSYTLLVNRKLIQQSTDMKVFEDVTRRDLNIMQTLREQLPDEMKKFVFTRAGRVMVKDQNKKM
ncbi:unnamed protein product, partial [Didymodactylos carnosus]